MLSSTLMVGDTPRVITPTLSGSLPTTLCNGRSTEVVANATGATRYVWSNGQPGVTITPLDAAASRVRITAPATGSYLNVLEVRAFNDALGCQASDPAKYTFRVGVSAAPRDIFINGLYSTATGEPIPPQGCGGVVRFQLMNGLSADVSGVVWTSDGVIISGQGSNTVSIRFPADVPYGSACARYTNACGTSDGLCATVPFREDCSGSGAPPACIDCDVYGFSTAYPTPATDELRVDGALGSVVLYNQLGRPVYQAEHPGRQLRISLRELPAGIYFLETKTPRKTYQRRMIRVQH